MNRNAISSTDTRRQDRPLLTVFLQELKTAQRNLALYPDEHPQITASIEKAMSLLALIMENFPLLTLGISPSGILFEQTWLDKNDPANRDFAAFFAELGIATINFAKGLTEAELLCFCKLLCSDRISIENSGGFAQLLEQHQIRHIQIITIDYNAFQVGRGDAKEEQLLWENFIYGMQQGILDLGFSEISSNLSVIAEIINSRFKGTRDDREQCRQSLSNYVEKRLITTPESEADQVFNELLLKLEPGARQAFLESTLKVIDRHQDQAENALKKISPRLLHDSFASNQGSQLQISQRLLGLVEVLAASDTDQKNKIRLNSPRMESSVVKARLETLFSEEQEDLFLPDSYQQALNTMLAGDLHGHMSEAEKLQLKQDMEEQSIEHHFAAVIFELLLSPLDKEQESHIQQSLMELSRFFADTGDFISLRAVFRNWYNYLYSNHAQTSILDEQLIAGHTQSSFMNDILDSFELWEEQKWEQISNYILFVGEPYCDPIIDRLSNATEQKERMLWMGLLRKIDGDVQQKVLQALRPEPWYLLRNLLIVLGEEQTPASIKANLKYADHPDQRVRAEVIRNLFRCNPATANRLLITELQNADLSARNAALGLVHLSQDSGVFSQLHRQLEMSIETAEQLHYVEAVIAALSRCGRPESLTIFRRLLLSGPKLFKSRHLKSLQQQILNALLTFPGSGADKLLDEMAKGPYKNAAKEVQEKRRTNL